MKASRYLLFILLFIAALMLAKTILDRSGNPEGGPIAINGITVPPLPALDPA